MQQTSGTSRRRWWRGGQDTIKKVKTFFTVCMRKLTLSTSMEWFMIIIALIHWSQFSLCHFYYYIFKILIFCSFILILGGMKSSKVIQFWFSLQVAQQELNGRMWPDLRPCTLSMIVSTLQQLCQPDFGLWIAEMWLRLPKWPQNFIGKQYMCLSWLSK